MLRLTAEFRRDRSTWLAYIMLGYFAYTQAALGPIMPFLRAELKIGYTVGALHLSAFAVGMIAVGLFGDRIAERRGRAWMYWTGSTGMAVAGVLFIVAPSVLLTVFSALVMGVMGTMLLVVIPAVLSDRHGGARAVALTESNLVAGLCAGLPPLAIGVFATIGLGWRPVLLLPAAALVVIALNFRHEPTPNPIAVAGRADGRVAPLPPAYWLYWGLMVAGISLEWCMVAWGADFLENAAGFSRVTASTLMSVFFAAIVLGRAVGSRLTRALPGRTVLLCAVLTTLAGFPIFWLAPGRALTVLGLFVTGLGIANLFPLAVSAGVETAPDRADAAASRAALAAGTAILTAPLALGWTADRVGIGAALGGALLLAVASLFLLLLANRSAAPQTPSPFPAE